MARKPTPNDQERTFADDELIVSKTDVHGRITYANRVFLRVSGYEERDVLGAPHSLIRHPDMPRAVFKLLWDTVLGGREIFAYVKNLAADGAYYWVFAHVTPTFDARGTIVGFHSNRRTPDRSALEVVEPLYREMSAAERGARSSHEQLAVGAERLGATLKRLGTSYDELMFRL